MKFGDWIPQIFYDLIGRIVPGGALIFVGIWLFCTNSQISDIAKYLFQDPVVPFSFLLPSSILLFYLIGILLGGIGFTISLREWKSKKLPWFPIEMPNTEKPGSGVPYMYDAIQFYCPQAGARCAKLRAEAHLCRTLLVGFIVLLVVWAVANFSIICSMRYWFNILLLLAGCAASYFFHHHLKIRSRSLLVNHWHMLGLNKNSVTNIGKEV
ncbi:membrane hypothetical protein [Desulfosarcina cetonica]|uniref:hypothetical protein n=1 Tax=Desulfosarcina cetonica TaxID=90730 RepID=UPI0012EE9A53|nr:hypothetical protein [Desulfosarcina cetonica]VTR64547.1 membrane hypothetical protein [Desulfosarcina cetonica]